MDKYERVLAAFNHEEPDRVPTFEGTIHVPELFPRRKPPRTHPGILFFDFGTSALLARTWPLARLLMKALRRPEALLPFVKPAVMAYTRVHRSLDLDLVQFAGGLPVVFKPEIFEGVRVTRRPRALWTPWGDPIVEEPSGSDAASVHGFLRDPADYDRLVEYDPDHPLNYVLVRRALEAARGKIALIFYVHGGSFFEALAGLFGLQRLFKLLVRDPGFVDAAVRDMSEYAVAAATRMGDLGVRLFYVSDDMGQAGRPMISPRTYRRHFLRPFKRFCRAVHRFGGKVMMHSCGNVTELVPMLVEAGLDALHPWEPTAGMDVFEGKKRWGDRLAIVGNVPLELLSRGTPAQVDAHVRELVAACAPGGGYVISSQHSLLPSVRLENYLAMLRAARRYGRYPLNLP
ncbi:MAG: hypothetical protein Kow0069_32430 [Promethearchaeota archaeon]